jgi:imidazolonepropionase-like amidohydrolase
VIKGGLVFDGTGARPGTVVLQESTITQVAYGSVEIVAGDVVDVTGKTVVPGLIDLHVHSPGTSGPYGFYPTSDEVPDHFKAMLRAGVTTYLDLGTSEHVIFEYRARVRDKKMLGPTVYAAGPLFTPTGGHPCYSGSPSGDFCHFIDSPADVAAAVGDLLPYKPDFIKIVLENGTPGRPLPSLSTASMAALQKAANDAGLRVIAHVSSSQDVTDALDAGIRLFAHLEWKDTMSSDLASRLAAAGAVIVPTIAVNDSLQRISVGQLTEVSDPAITDDVPVDVIAALKDPAQLGFLTSPAAQALFGSGRDNVLANLKTCVAAGVKIAAGTDAGNPGTFHGLALAREVGFYVTAGMSTVDALNTATRNAADVLGRPDLGRIQRGAVADLVIVEGNPMTDIGALSKVALVYKDGVPVDRSALALPKGTSLVKEPVTGAAANATCLAANECAAELVCPSWIESCAASCSLAQSGSCPQGSACMPADSSGTAGYCQKGDACDLIAQNCPNAAACVFAGSSVTLCASNDPAATPGNPCDSIGSCVRGSQCDFSAGPPGACFQLCMPGGPNNGGCPGGKSCVDQSAQAGLAIGECK